MGAFSCWVLGASLTTTVITNRAVNPSYETNTTSWTAQANATIGRATSGGLFGSSYMTVEHTSSGSSVAATQTFSGLTVGNSYTITVYVLRLAGTQGAGVGVTGTMTPTSATSEAFAASPTAWTRLRYTFVATGTSHTAQVFPASAYNTASTGTGAKIGVDGWMITDGSSVIDYFDGSFSPAEDVTYAWTGTAHASTSTKTVTSVNYLSDFASRRQAFETNINSLMRLFTRGHKLSTVRAAQPDGTIRRAQVEWREWSEPEVQAGGTRAEWAIAYTIPSVWWEDENVTVQSGSGTLDLTSFANMTGIIEDAVITVTGASTAPKVTDAETGAFVQYTGNLTSGQQWVIDVDAFTSKVGGTSVMANTIHSGGYKLLVIPNCFGTSNTPRLVLSGGGTISVSARRKWANG